MIQPNEVTIIIPHLGGSKESEFALDQCIKSLQETVPDIKKIVVCNGFIDDNPICNGKHECSVGDPNVEFILMTAQGQCKAVNAAIATTNTRWVFVTNDDMIYAPGWFEKLGNTYYDIGCVSPRLVEPRPGAPTFEVFFAGGAGGDFDKQKFLEYAEKHKEQPYSIETGFNLPFLIRRDIWDTVGGYDVNYDPWGSNSDSDLEYKIKLAGIQPMQNQGVVVYHFSQTSGTFEPRNQSYWQKNWEYFIKKWGFPRTDIGIWDASFTIPSKEEGRIFNPKWEGKYAH